MDEDQKKQTAETGELPGSDGPELIGGPDPAPEPDDYYTRHRPLSEHTGVVLSKDFLTGCLTLVVGGLLVFFAAVFAGVLVVAYKVTVWLAVPVAALVAIVLLTTLVGRIVNMLYGAWAKKKQAMDAR